VRPKAPAPAKDGRRNVDDHGLPPAYGTDVAIHFWEDTSARAKRTETCMRKHGEDKEGPEWEMVAKIAAVI
jgi:hypothetical protein